MDNILAIKKPLSEPEWDKIFDAEFEKTDYILITTPSGKKVIFAKVDAIKQKIDKELGYRWKRNRYSEGYTDGILYVWKVINNICEEISE